MASQQAGPTKATRPFLLVLAGRPHRIALVAAAPWLGLLGLGLPNLQSLWGMCFIAMTGWEARDSVARFSSLEPLGIP